MRWKTDAWLGLAALLLAFTESSATNCATPNQFNCGNGTCVALAKKCDGKSDCYNGEDEQFCLYATTCFPGESPCGDGRTCFSSSQRCDGFSDCMAFNASLTTSVDELFCYDRCNMSGGFMCDNGNCLSRGLVCDFDDQCGDNSDELNCAYSVGVFRCDGGRSVPKTARCNRQFDCGDHSDELDCPCAGADALRCANGLCLSAARTRCNGVDDCGDASDEPANCTCLPSQLSCGDGTCYPAYGHCDRNADCVSGADEKNCKCLFSEFGCSNSMGPCINKLKKCDGHVDCPDASDELSCTCGPKQFTCPGGGCIPYAQYCDGMADCFFGGDEPADCLSTCPFGQKCNGRCYPATIVCDGFSDCTDGTDEKDCEPCADIVGGFKCSDDGRCLQAGAKLNSGTCSAGNVGVLPRCNGVRECSDGSDESGCTCGALLAASHPEYLCDGYPDCSDQSDEVSCPCPGFTCGGKCLNNAQVCDGNVDCMDSEDEKSCLFLSANLTALPASPSTWPLRRAGQLVGRLHSGAFGPLCVDGIPPLVLQNAICQTIGFSASANESELYPASTPGFPASPSRILLTSASSVINLKNMYSKFQPSGSNCPNLLHLVCYNTLACVTPPQFVITDSPSGIVGGQPAAPSAWPFAANILAEGQQRCGATLLPGGSWVMTGANCIRGLLASQLVIRFGWPHSASAAAASTQRRAVAAVVHPTFDVSSMDGDIALLKLDSPVPTTASVRPICALPTPQDVFPAGGNCYSIGWGLFYPGGPRPDALNHVALTLQNSSVCGNISINKADTSPTFGPDMICAGVIAGGQGPCKGDSGSPLICPDAAGVSHVVGITSWGRVCAGPNDPTMYTRVASYTAWIQATTREGTSPTPFSAAYCAFRCGNGRCLPTTRLCDGNLDCGLSAEDEAASLCKVNASVSCAFTSGGLCGWRRDLAFSRTTQWGWVADRRSLAQPITGPPGGFLAFIGGGNSAFPGYPWQRGALVSPSFTPSATQCAAFAFRQTGPKSAFSLQLCSIGSGNCSTLFSSTGPMSFWQPQNLKFGVGDGSQYTLRLVANFSGTATPADIVAISNLTLGPCHIIPAACDPSKDNKFLCNTGRCINNLQYCDGRVDCLGGEDETNCTLRPCNTPGAFYCPSGVHAPARTLASAAYCIPGAQKCDGNAQCVAGEDEAGCPCPTGSKRCANGQCLADAFWCNGADDCGDDSDEAQGCNCTAAHTAQLCDGVRDCPDGSDEANCAQCAPNTFACPSSGYKPCLSDTQVCDGVSDCLNGDDELDCISLNGTAMGSQPQLSFLKQGMYNGQYSLVSYPICSGNLKQSQHATVAQNICGLLGYAGVVQQSSMPIPSAYAQVAMYSPSSSGAAFLKSFKVVASSNCPLGLGVTVQCGQRICGQSGGGNSVGEGIYDGYVANVRALPWAASVYGRQPPAMGPRNEPLCGGSVIAPRWILTSYSCVSGTSGYTHSVGVGANRRSSAGAQVIPVATSLSPAQSNTALYMNDIALLYLASPITFSSKVSPICLPNPFLNATLPTVGTLGTAAGWGSTSSDIGSAYGGPLANNLRAVNLTLTSCAGMPGTVASRDLCATPTSTPEDAGLCASFGDHGDGLYLNSAGSWTLGGVFSRRQNPAKFNCASSKPVFTATFTYSTWITNTMACFESGSKWGCQDGTQCVGWAQLCDGTPQCADGSDEAACPSVGPCGPGQFRCKTKSCVAFSGWCDGVADCPDSSDELANCAAVCPGFSCDDGAKCLPASQRCDAVPDCQDGTDELFCANCTSPGSFRCGSGQCLSSRFVCNGVADCVDGSDESSGCSCLAALPKSAICDGVRDCPCNIDIYGVLQCPDESECGCSVLQFTCPPTAGYGASCVDRSKLCDGFPDCSDGTDEAQCLRVHDSVLYALVNGKEKPICGDSWSTAVSHQLCQAQGFLSGYRPYIADTNRPIRAYSAVAIGSGGGWQSWWSYGATCTATVQLSVGAKEGRCGIPQCGLRLPFPSLYLGSESRFLAVKASAETTSPFVGALYFRGAFVCAGVLVRANAFATSADCLRRNTFQADQWVVRLGFGRLSGTASVANYSVVGFSRRPSSKPQIAVLTLGGYAASSIGLSWPACQAPPSLRPADLSACVALGWDSSAISPGGLLDQLRIPVRLETSPSTCPSGFCVGHIGADSTNSAAGLMGSLNGTRAATPCMGPSGGVVLCKAGAGGPWLYAAQLNSLSGCLSAGPQPALFLPSLGGPLLEEGGFGNPCQPNPCLNGGSCITDGIDFTCDCPTSFEGDACEHFTCGGALNSSSGGQFRSPLFPAAYPANADCTWIINAPPGRFIHISFPSFALQNSSGCSSDAISLYERWSLSPSTFLGRFCGAAGPTAFTTAGDQLSVRFQSDGTTQRAGFSAVYSIVSCGGVLKGPMGSVQSPGFPLGYPNNAACVWTIDSSDAIALNFSSLTLEGGFLNNECPGDYVGIGTDKFCKNPGAVITTNKTSVLITFETDTAESFGGFNLTWFPDMCASNPCSGNGICTNTPGLGYYCTCPPGYTGSSCLAKINLCTAGGVSPCLNSAACVPLLNNYKCLCRAGYEGRNCGQLMNSLSLSGTSGSFATTNFPANYPNNLHFEWYITVPAGMVVSLGFSSFSVEAQPRCRWDSVQLFSGLPFTPDYQKMQTYCDVHKPPRSGLKSSGNTMTVIFDSDASGTESGFNASFVAVAPGDGESFPGLGRGTPCNASISGSGGLIESPQFPQYYPTGQTCVWTIHATFGSIIHLNLLSLHLRNTPCYDTLAIYEAGVIDAGHLAKNLSCAPSTGAVYSYDSVSPLVSVVFTAGSHAIFPSYPVASGFALEYVTSDAYCHANICQNGGTCSLGMDFTQCACAPGFSGLFCETSTACSSSLSTVTTIPAGHSAVITSPNFPADYEISSTCYWHLLTDPGYVLHLTFSAFVLEKSWSGCYDYVRLANTSSLYNMPMLCGAQLPASQVSATNQSYIQFHSDTSTTYVGFALNITSAPDFCKQSPCHKNEFCVNGPSGAKCPCLPGWEGPDCLDQTNLCSSDPCEHNGTCVPKFNGFNCGCAPGYSGSTCSIDTVCGYANSPCQNGATCVRSGPGGTKATCRCTDLYAGTYCQFIRCGGALTVNGSGLAISPNFPYQYPESIRCEWILTTPAPNSIIKLYFDDCEMNYYHYDYLNVYDGLSVNKTIIKSITGYESPGYFLSSTGNTMSLVLVSDEQTHYYGGFKARYFNDEDACSPNPCNAQQTCKNGISSGNYTCPCLPNYTGPSCQTPKDYCGVLYPPCRNGATCSNNPTTPNGFTCACAPGFTGTTCGTQMDNCESNPCLNGGSCLSLATSFKCNCPTYFTGQDCGVLSCLNQVLPASSGSVASPGFGGVGYPPNASCSWTLAPTDPRMLTYVTLNSFHLEGPSPTCQYDYLQLLNRTTEQPTVDKICGMSLPQGAKNLVLGPGPVAFKFHSDATVSGPGFQLSYLTVLPGYCNATASDGNGLISSLGYPNSLQPNSLCQYSLQVPTNARISLLPVALDLPMDNCSSSLSVYDGYEVAPWLLSRRLCGGDPGDWTLTSATNVLTVVFRSGPVVGTHKGFTANHTSDVVPACANVSCRAPDSFCAVSSGVGACKCYDGFHMDWAGACTQQTCGSFSNNFKCQNGGSCVNDAQLGPRCNCPPYFTGRRCQTDVLCKPSANPCGSHGTCGHGPLGVLCACNPGWTGRHCTSKLPPYRCGGVISSFPALVASPHSYDDPPFYPPSASCSWTLMAPAGLAVAFHIDELKIEESSGCAFDFLQLIDSDGTSVLANLCGTEMPSSSIVSSGSRMSVIFQSDESVNEPGFSARAYTSTDFCAAQHCPAHSRCANSLTDAHCTCLPGWTGATCNTPVDYCASFQCANGGTCSSPNSVAVCACAVGFTGTHCMTKINLCNADPCLNGATCTPSFMNFTCQCMPGYYGHLCQNAPCGGVISSSVASGVVSSPGFPLTYPSGANCTWTIHGGHRKILRLRILSLDLEGPQGNCIYDALTLYDGPDTNSPVIQKLCGRHRSVDLISSADNVVTLHLNSDATIQYSGFEAVWNQSGYSCYNYACPAHAACVIDSRLSPHCVCDYDYAGPNCTKIDNCAFVNCQNGATCVDGLGHFSCNCVPGWTGQFCQTRVDACASFPCANGGICTPQGLYYTCSCPPLYAPGTCENPRIPVNLFLPSGGQSSLNLTTPNYPNNYDEDSHKLWTISGPPNSRLQLIWLNFAVATDVGPNCSPNYGMVRLWDANYTQAFSSHPKPVGVYCGFDTAAKLTSSGVSLSVTFDSGNSPRTSQGFLARISVICNPGWTGPNCDQPDLTVRTSICGGGLLPANGQLISPGFPGEFGSASCSRRLVAPPGRQYRLSVAALSLDPNCALNYIQVDDGATVVLHRCGSALPAAVISADATVFFFAVGPSAPGLTGFELTYIMEYNFCFGVNCGHGTCVNGQTNYQCKCYDGWTGPACSLQVFNTYQICSPTSNEFVEAANGYITTEGWPNHYLSSEFCYLNLMNPEPGYSIAFTFLNMSIDAKSDCASSYVSLFDHQNSFDSNFLIGTYCGLALPAPPLNVTTRNVLSFEFHSGAAAVSGSGFRLQFSSVKNFCTGATCERNSHCVNHMNNYTCVCNAGYTGPNCDVDVDECLSSPCKNGGTCKNEPFTFQCKCPFGYIGPTCETDTVCNPWTCSSGATCVHTNTGANCVCPPGFSGPRCAQVTCDGELTASTTPQTLTSPGFPQNYPNDAHCTWTIFADNAQQIQTRFTNLSLENAAQSSGVCKYDYVSIWRSLPAGNADVVLCGEGLPPTFANNVTSVHNQMQIGFTSDVTVSKSGFSLSFWAVPNICASNPCPPNSTCSSSGALHSCTCNPGWIGPNCNISFNDCANNPCLNGGTCIDDYRSYRCTCPSKYNGNNCQNVISYCEPNPCQNHGICVDGPTNYTCNCLPGLTGKTCTDCIPTHETTSKGDFSSPLHPVLPYPSPITCLYTIIPSRPLDPREGIQLNFLKFDIGDTSTGCSTGDNLTVYNSPAPNNRPAFVLCEKTFAGNGYYFLPSGQISLVFTSTGGNAAGHTGFHLSYHAAINYCRDYPCLHGGICSLTYNGHSCHCPPGWTGGSCETPSGQDCGGAITNVASAAITSPNFPGYYPTNVYCKWNITTPANFLFSLRYTEFEVEGFDGRCPFDFVNITDLGSGKMFGPFCSGVPPPDVLQINSGRVAIDFFSDYALIQHGFELLYDAVEPLCANVTCPEKNEMCIDNVNRTTSCICLRGWTGADCNTRIDECVAHHIVCVNGGTCRNLATAGDWECACLPGYYGSFCQADRLCENITCAHGGRCYHSSNTTGACDCPRGFGGPRCQTARCGGVFAGAGETSGRIAGPIDPTKPGVVVPGVDCVWTMEGDETQIVHLLVDFVDLSPGNIFCPDDSIVFYNGREAAIHNTIMPPGVLCGSRPSFELASSGPSLTVVFHSAVAPAAAHAGFAARFLLDHNDCRPFPCADPVRQTCTDLRNHTAVCSCKSGWTGTNCQTSVNDCLSTSCENGATCVDGLNSVSCVCPIGFHGSRCQYAYDYCSPSPCHNGATCVGSHTGYTCACPVSQLYKVSGVNCTLVACNNVTLAGNSGVLSTPQFMTNSFPPNLNCAWTILPANPVPNAIVAINFVSLSLEGPVGSCIYDSLTIYSGSVVTSAALQTRLCGSKTPTTQIVKSSSAVVQFISDASVNVGGFKLSYVVEAFSACVSAPCLNGGSCVPNATLATDYSCNCPDGFFGGNCELNLPNTCSTTFNTASGGFSSPGYPHAGRGRQNCQYTITMPQRNTTMALHFVSFDIGGIHSSNFSFLDCKWPIFGDNSLTLYGMEPPSDVVIPIGKPLCGQGLPTPDIRIPYSQLRLSFVKPFIFVPHDGFALTWTEDICSMAKVNCGPGAVCVNTVGTGPGYACRCKPGLLGQLCDYNAECANVSLGGSVGSFASPRFPDFYTDNAACSWIISAPAGSAISVTLEFLEVEGVFPGCLEDQLRFFSSSAWPPLPVNRLAQFCGNASQPTVTSETGQMLVTFNTDRSIVRKGFSARYNIVSQGCANYDCANGGTCGPNPLNGLPVCACAPGYSGNFCEIDVWCSYGFCQHGGLCSHGARGAKCACVSNYVGIHCEHLSCNKFAYIGQTLTSPNYPLAYPNNVNCEYLIEGPSPGLALRINTLSLEFDPTCSSDYLSIRGGWNDASAPLLGSYCDGSKTPAIVGSAQLSQLTALFHSDATTSAAGFNVTVLGRLSCLDVACQNGGTCVLGNASASCLCPLQFQGSLCQIETCGFNISQSSGSFASIGYPSYPAGTACLYTIRRPPSQRVRLDFHDFDTEPFYDFVQVFDGADLYAPLIERIDGLHPFLSFLSSGPAITVYITSDEATARSGFKANFSSVLSVANVSTSAVGHLASSQGSSKFISWRQTFLLSDTSQPSLQLNFSSFLTSDAPPCQRNYLDIYKADGTFFKRFCGVLQQHIVDVPGSSARLVWNLDDYHGATQNFALSYQGFQDYCAKKICPAGSFCQNAASGAHCICLPGPDGESCRVPCGGKLSGMEGRITSPRFPDTYPTKENCNWTISVPTGQVVMAQVYIFDIEESASHTCFYDYLQFTNSDATIINKSQYCGQNLGFSVTSSGASLGVLFKSDFLTSGAGFVLDYYAVSPGCGSVVCQNGGTCTAVGGHFVCQCAAGFSGPFCLRDDWCGPDPCDNGGTCLHANGGTCVCPSLLTGPKCDQLVTPVQNYTTLPATITSPGYPYLYPANIAATYNLNFGTNTSFNLLFTDFHLEKYFSSCSINSFDYLSITDTGGKQVVILCGEILPPIVNLVGSAQLHFVTDLSNQLGGFSISVTQSTALCSATYCLNGGSCTANGDILECTCQPGYEGYHCEIDKLCASVYCLNNGTCEHVGAKAVCVCPPYATGPTCGSVVCGGSFHGILDGQIASPAYPNPFPPGANCSWTINEAAGSRISVQFLALDVPSMGEDCAQDALIITDSAPNTIPLNFCGHRIPPVFTSQGSSVQITFRSFAIPVRGAGFQIHFSSSFNASSVCMNYCRNGGTCSPPTPFVRNPMCHCPAGWTGAQCEIDEYCQPNPCLNNALCSHAADGSGYTCACNQAFLTGTNCETVICGANITAQAGAIQTPGWGLGAYPPYSDCIWRIMDGNKKMRTTSYSLNATSFALEGPGTLGCQFDFLELDVCYGDPNIQPTCYAALEGTPKFCGTTLSKTTRAVNVTGNGWLKLRFHSDASVQLPGFQLLFSAATAPVASACVGYCQFGGNCSLVSGLPVCHCLDGFSGPKCGTTPCASSPCLNRGTCRADESDPGGFYCSCPLPFHGNICQNDSCSLCSIEGCQNGGTCVPNAACTDRTCICPSNCSGAQCDSCT